MAGTNNNRKRIDSGKNLDEPRLTTTDPSTHPPPSFLRRPWDVTRNLEPIVTYRGCNARVRWEGEKMTSDFVSCFLFARGSDWRPFGGYSAAGVTAPVYVKGQMGWWYDVVGAGRRRWSVD